MTPASERDVVDQLRESKPRLQGHRLTDQGRVVHELRVRHLGPIALCKVGSKKQRMERSGDKTRESRTLAPYFVEAKKCACIRVGSRVS
jgi:hypothetical protein